MSHKLVNATALVGQLLDDYNKQKDLVSLLSKGYKDLSEITTELSRYVAHKSGCSGQIGNCVCGLEGLLDRGAYKVGRFASEVMLEVKG